MCSSALNSVSFFRSPQVILTGAGRGVREQGPKGWAGGASRRLAKEPARAPWSLVNLEQSRSGSGHRHGVATDQRCCCHIVGGGEGGSHRWHLFSLAVLLLKTTKSSCRMQSQGRSLQVMALHGRVREEWVPPDEA